MMIDNDNWTVRTLGLLALVVQGCFVSIMHWINMHAAFEWHLETMRCEQLRAKYKSLVEYSMPKSALQKLEHGDLVFDRLSGVPIL